MNQRLLLLLSLSACLALPLAGCTDPTSVDDDDDSAGDDDDDDDAGFTTTMNLTGDFGCLTEDWPVIPDPPVDTASYDITVRVVDFSDDIPVEGQNVTIWADNDTTRGVGDADWAGGPTEISGGAGAGELPVGTGVVPACTPWAYRVEPVLVPPNSVVTYEVGEILPPPAGGAGFGVHDLTSVSTETYQLVPLILGIDPDPAKGIAAGTLRDCNDEPVEGAEAIVVPRSGDWRSYGPGDMDSSIFVRYFEEETPSRNQDWTSADGVFAAVDVPPGEWRVVLWGIRDGVTCEDDHPDHSPVCPVAYSDIFVIENSVNIGNVNLQAYPPACFGN